MDVDELWENSYRRPDREQPVFYTMGLKHAATSKQLYENPNIKVEELALFDFMMSRPYALLRGGSPGITRVRRYLSKYKRLSNRIITEGFTSRVSVIKVEGKYVIRDGHRRLNIVRALGMKTIPVRELIPEVKKNE
jgi:hypothetical protein